MTPPLAPGEKLSFSPTFFAPQAESPPVPSGCNRLFYGTLPGLHPGPYRCWLASAGAIRQTTHKAFSEFWVQRHGGEPPLPNCAAALENRIGLGLHLGPYRVMVYHTRSRKA